MDTASFFFCNEKPGLDIKAIASKVVAIVEGNNNKVSEMTYGQDGEGFFTSFWSSLRDDGSDILAVLTYLGGLSGSNSPHAKVELDQTGEVFYYALDGRHLVTFDSQNDLSEHLKSAGQSSVEELMVSRTNPKYTLLFVRLKFSKKRSLVDYHKAAIDFIAEKSAVTYSTLKQLLDANSYTSNVVDYPFASVFRDEFAKHNMSPEAMEEYGQLIASMGEDETDDEFYERVQPRLEKLEKQRYQTEPLASSKLGNLKLGEALSQCIAQKSFLFLVFEHEKQFGVSPCTEGKQTWHARNNILNGEGLQVLELMECFILQQSIDSVSAKLYSSCTGSGASFFNGEDGIECLPWWQSEPLPLTIWP